ncbi:MAG: DUF5615 family PIN-like protein [Candidatus Hodarchaeota archaeon]
MKRSLILDENIPKSTMKRLENDGFQIFSIRQNKPGITDKEIIELSKKQKKPIVTLDKDFGYLVYNQNLKPYCVLLIRIKPQLPDQIYGAISRVLKWIEKENITLNQKFIVFDGISLRIRKI